MLSLIMPTIYPFSDIKQNFNVQFIQDIHSPGTF